MLQFIFAFVLFIGACHGAATGFQCREMPRPKEMCIDVPQNVSLHRPVKELKHCEDLGVCEALNCYFTEEGYMINGTLVANKMTQILDEQATMIPEWQGALDHVKSECVMKKLPAQGILLNCPVVDYSHCATHMLLKYAPDSKWKTTPECEALRHYSRNCPLCPDECFAASKPEGSCNACNPNAN